MVYDTCYSFMEDIYLDKKQIALLISTELTQNFN